MRTLLENVYICGGSSYHGDANILIDDGRIVKIQEKTSWPIAISDASVDRVICCDGLYIAPGLVDTHVHFRDPGQTWKEDIFTGAEAAKRGGYTTVVMMANTTPPIDNVETLEYVLEKGAETGIHVKACAALTVGMEGKELVDMPALVEAGAVGFSDDGKTIMDEKLLCKAMEMAAELGVPISLHEEDPRFITQPGFNDSSSVYFGLGISGASREAEYTMIKRDLKLAAKTGATVNFQHISCMESVGLIRYFKEDYPSDVHAEVTPHHFSLTEDDAIKLGILAKMNPPLRTDADRKAIVWGICDGTLDLIATDHAPHSGEEKARGLVEAPSGVIGLETALALAITKLYEPIMGLTLSGDAYAKIIGLMSTNPARMYGFDGGWIEESAPADFVIFDPYEEWTVHVEEFASKSINSPFIGQKLKGKVKMTICDGEVVYWDHQA